MRRTHSAGGVVVNQQSGKVLVVSQHNTSWSLPKGHINPGENALTAAVREIAEESGIRQVKIIKELGSYERYQIGKDGGDDHSELKAITLFLCSTTQEVLKPIDPDNPEARWVKADMVSSILTHPKDKAFYDQVYSEVSRFIDQHEAKS